MQQSNLPKRILVTGGAGFIGSATIRHLLEKPDVHILNVDKLSYAASGSSLQQYQDRPNYQFINADICDQPALENALLDFQPEAIIHTAAESHVDRSISASAPFIQSNIIGTHSLLEATFSYWQGLSQHQQQSLRFLHISTDEVYGSLPNQGQFSETTPYAPRNPYSASKAGSDHLVMAWHHTYGLPVLISHCSNNYGPFQYPEKLIPLIILNAIEQLPLPIYGNGNNIRDWLYVEDNARAIELILTAGKVGQTYNVGANNERTNLEVVDTLCSILDELCPLATGDYRELITMVADRPGHDQRYATDASKIKNELGWSPQVSFESGIHQTVRWYLENDWWWKPLRQLD